MPGLEKNRIYRAHIDGYSSEGLGIARIDGQVVFVHGAIRGEICDVLVMKVLKNAAFGKAVRVYAPSPHRVEPDCPYYGRCGGCDFRHMDREEELDAKRQRVQDALRRIGGSDVTVEGILSGGHRRRRAAALPQQEPVPRIRRWAGGVLQGPQPSGDPGGLLPDTEAPGRRGGGGPAAVHPGVRRALLR